MTRYLTVVDDGLLPQLRSGEGLPSGFRLVAEVGKLAPPHHGATLAEFEDDGAPAELEGRVVTPTFQAHYGNGVTSVPTRTTITAREVDHTRYELLGRK